MPRYTVQSDAGTRTWEADSALHALEQHTDAFGNEEALLVVMPCTPDDEERAYNAAIDRLQAQVIDAMREAIAVGVSAETAASEAEGAIGEVLGEA